MGSIDARAPGYDPSFETCPCETYEQHQRGLCRAARPPRPRGREAVPVIVESPYAGDTDLEVERNLAYLRACMRDCLQRGEAPFASHGLYTQPGVLRDGVPAERELGIRSGFAWRRRAARTVVYTDLGLSPGMLLGIDDARDLIWQGLEYRQLGGVWADGGAAALVEAEATTERRTFCPECGVNDPGWVDAEGCCPSCGSPVCTLDRLRAALHAHGLFLVSAGQTA